MGAQLGTNLKEETVLLHVGSPHLKLDHLHQKPRRAPIQRRNADLVAKAVVPFGLRFKGYQNFVVQELVLRAHVLRLWRACWVTPDGQRITAPLPAGLSGHFGPELRRFVLALLRGIGISKRHPVRLLRAGHG